MHEGREKRFHSLEHCGGIKDEVTSADSMSFFCVTLLRCQLLETLLVTRVSTGEELDLM